jgi:hypothetical protein
MDSLKSATDLGYYFSDWIWDRESSDFMKSMLLFFDGLTLSLPSERGLLVNFAPADVLDEDSAEQLALALNEIIKQIPFAMKGRRQGLVSYHWGAGVAAIETIRAFEKTLEDRGLASPGTEFGMYDIDGPARTLILLLFAHTLQNMLRERGLALHLATNSEWLSFEIEGWLSRYPGHTRHADPMNPFLLRRDLIDVGADLSAVPLDEVLDFREENGQHYRAYARGLRELLALGVQTNPAEQRRLLEERSLEIREQAAALRRVSRNAFGTRAAALLVSLAGAAWTLHTGDSIGAILAGSAAGIQALPVEGQPVTAYSYLMRARELGNR